MSGRASGNHGRRFRTLVHDLRTRWRQRRELAMMDDTVLRELALTAADVDRELKKPFWRRLSVAERE
jgi:uncharacterized protein YjiS (DUF1127 family)